MKMSVHEDIDIDGNGTEAVTGIGRCVGRSVKGDRSLWFDGSERAPRMATTGSIQKGRSCCLSSREQGQDANDLHGPSNSGSCQGPGQGDLCRLNHTHLTELLEEREGIDLSRSTVRRILLSGGIKSPRKRRAPKHHSRRVRYPQEGMLLQIDGSKHDWLQGRGPYLTLIAAIDDATGTVPFALFRDQEDAHGYLLMLRSIIQDKGVPMALYSDRHGIFQRSPKEPESLEEQLRGRRDPTQFGRALQELGIELILAYTPQAKGRVERLFGTLQDRLVSEMRLAGATTAQQANNILWRLLPDFNRRFGVCAAQQGSAYRQLSADLSLDSVLCFKYLRTVANDNTVRFNSTTLQLLPDAHRASLCKGHSGGPGTS